MRSEPRWITDDVVVLLNRELLAGTSEPHLLMSSGLLSSACASPQNYWAYSKIDDVVTLAVILVFAIASNHPFVQGNKRTAFAAMKIFLEDNGYGLNLADDTKFADDLIAVLGGDLEKEIFEDRLREVVVLQS